MLFFVVHLLGCGWYLVPALGVEDPEDTWVARRGILGEGPGTLWLHSIYFVLTTFTTVGFGDITPFQESEVAFACLLQMAGAIIFFLVMQSCMQVVNYVDVSRQELSERQRLVKA